MGGKIKNNWMKLITSGVEVYNLDYDQPHSTLFEKRGLGRIANDYNHLSLTTQETMATHFKRFVIGDSHSISVCPHTMGCLRTDGRTLKGALKRGQIQAAVAKHNPTDILCYFGNIDARFHWGQSERDMVATATSAAMDYADVLLNLPCKVKAMELLPFPTDDRKIPNSGKLNGENFYGSFEDRQQAIRVFNSTLRARGVETVQWDFDYNQPLPKEAMEAGGSVHLAPKAYRW